MQEPSNFSASTAAIVGALILSIFGLVMQFQSVTLLTGTGLLWVGVACAAGGAIAAFAFRVKIGIRIATAGILAYCVINAIYIENQLEQRRQEIQQILNK